MIPSKTQVAVIGSGLSGMICALELKRHNFDVCIFEKSIKPGGYAHSFKRKGFTFDVSLHHLGGLEKGGLTYEMLKPLGVLDKIEFEKRDILFTSRFPDSTITIPNSRQDSLLFLSELFPKEKANLKKMFDYLETLKEHTVARILYPDYSISPEESLNAKHRDDTFYQLLNLFIKDEKLKTIVAQLWMYLGLPPEESTANYTNCIFTSSFMEGTYHIKGGGYAVTKAIVETLEENNVKIYTKNAVKRIVAENGNVKGVELASGDFVEADYVVSNADPYQTVFELLPEDQISKIFKFRLNQMQPSLSIYAMYLGLDCSTESLGIPESNYFYNESYNLEQAYKNSIEGKVEKTDWCLSNYASKFNDFSNETNGVLSVAELTPAGNWFDLDKDEYKAQKERVKNIMLDKYDKQFPGLKDHAKIIEFGTPKTMKRYSGNHMGAIYGLAQTVSQSNNRRLANRLPINGAFLVGSWTQAGGGYEGAMMGGLQTAHSVIDVANKIWMKPGIFFNEEHKNTTKKIPEHDYLIYPFIAKVYPDDVDYTTNIKSTGYLRVLDRARVELGNQSEELIAIRPILDECFVNLYQIIINVHDYAKLNSSINIRTGYRKNTSHRASVDQVIYDEEGNLLAEAVSDIMFVKKGGDLIELPAAYPDNVTLPFDLGKAKLPKIMFSNKEHFTNKSEYTIYYEDTDAQGIVYNVSYVKLCEKAFWDIRDKIYDDGKPITAKPSRIEIRFAKSLSLGDVVEIWTGTRIINDKEFAIDYRLINKATGDILTDVYIEYKKD